MVWPSPDEHSRVVWVTLAGCLRRWSMQLVSLVTSSSHGAAAGGARCRRRRRRPRGAAGAVTGGGGAVRRGDAGAGRVAVLHAPPHALGALHVPPLPLVAPPRGGALAYAAQYGHPVDGVLTETLSGAAAYVASGMTPRAAAAFFAFATVKGVDDHCGVAAPWNPIQAAFRNNAAYNDVHHQRGGGRRNFSQPFFVVWDRLLGTQAPYALRQRDGGGLEVRAFKPDPTR
ncbi:sphinganine C(4)-monooxygenase 1-like isoform X1 [Panicum miliaceum]|uniref:aldehyde oxygenase (deformylating) n=1 Tax=Panicum miliaceum TaxID=4540 RepID=A0A3L6R1M1_PANMI|nr:sphinganine C(4)-monooxygenase 1-like isoform X1 [Panicum miliaceum]